MTGWKLVQAVCKGKNHIYEILMESCEFQAASAMVDRAFCKSVAHRIGAETKTCVCKKHMAYSRGIQILTMCIKPKGHTGAVEFWKNVAEYTNILHITMLNHYTNHAKRKDAPFVSRSFCRSSSVNKFFSSTLYIDKVALIVHPLHSREKRNFLPILVCKIRAPKFGQISLVRN